MGEASCHVALCSRVCAMGARLAVQGPHTLVPYSVGAPPGAHRHPGRRGACPERAYGFRSRKALLCSSFVAGKLCAFVLGKTISIKEELTPYLKIQNLRVPVGLPRAGGVRLPTLRLRLPEGAGVQGTARLSARGISSTLDALLCPLRAPKVKAVHSGFGAGHLSDDRLRLRARSVSRPPGHCPHAGNGAASCHSRSWSSPHSLAPATENHASLRRNEEKKVKKNVPDHSRDLVA